MADGQNGGELLLLVERHPQDTAFAVLAVDEVMELSVNVECRVSGELLAHLGIELPGSQHQSHIRSAD